MKNPARRDDGGGGSGLMRREHDDVVATLDADGLEDIESAGEGVSRPFVVGLIDKGELPAVLRSQRVEWCSAARDPQETSLWSGRLFEMTYRMSSPIPIVEPPGTLSDWPPRFEMTMPTRSSLAAPLWGPARSGRYGSSAASK